MKWFKPTYFSLVFLIFILSSSCNRNEDSIIYTTGEWDADSLGYHRIEISVANSADAIYVNIPWRRRDPEPHKKGVILTSGSTGEIINNIYRLKVNNEAGEYIFQPRTGKGIYYLYYLPGTMVGRSNYPTVNYPDPFGMADNAWIGLHSLSDSLNVHNFPEAKVVSIQSRDEFNSFYPMEIIATGEEAKQLIESHPDKDFLLFPETRYNSIRMDNYIPHKWFNDGAYNSVSGDALLGEYFTFQVGVFAHAKNLEGIHVSFTDLTDKKGSIIIPSERISSFNTEGSGWDGIEFIKTLNVEKGKIQALWFGLMIPEGTKPGQLNGKLSVSARGIIEVEDIDIELNIENKVIENHGDNEPSRMSRMRWFNSDLAFNNEIVDPFIPVSRNGSSLKILGREINIKPDGMPGRYKTYFNSVNTQILTSSEDVLSGPMVLDLLRPDNSIIYLRSEGTNFSENGPGKLSWSARSSNRDIVLLTEGSLESDGFATITFSLTARNDMVLKDIRLTIPLKREFAAYMMGLGRRGGRTPYFLRWKWDEMNHQEGAWIGNVNGGIQFALRDETYERPLNTNFYREKPLIMPEVWYNEGKGGINISGNETEVRIENYSGRISIRSGSTVTFKINLLLTPFKTIDTDQQWSTRFYHRYEDLDSILDYGANTVNVHHATEINPWINYPFLEQEKMKAYIQKAHSMGMKVKIYNTIRELSNRAPELFAIRSFGHEIFSPGNGKGFNWLQEHLVDDYIAAWFVPPLKDAAIINSGMSRWHNYYIEGMDWLGREMEIDGLYLDDVAFDRTTMKRLRKVLDNNNEGALIDLHSANQYNVRDGFTNSANLYMEHFPYINRLWFGEYFDHNLPPDFWLVEISGIPYGLMGEMLQDGGNQYRGMLYGITSRAPWSGDPRSIWNLWDDFGIENCDYIGYWSEDSPVSTGYRLAPASVFLKEDKTMVAVASWYEESKNVWLRVDWGKVGLDRSNSVFRLPYIPEFQDSAIYKPWESIPVEPGKGFIIIIEEKLN